jgi:hypothetical protein
VMLPAEDRQSPADGDEPGGDSHAAPRSMWKRRVVPAAAALAGITLAATRARRRGGGR